MTEDAPAAHPEGWAPLAKTIQALRSELTAAMRSAENEDLQFRLDPVELEFHLGVTHEGGAEAGIRLWVVTLGAKGSSMRDQTHMVKLTLTPHLASRPDCDVNVGTAGELG